MKASSIRHWLGLAALVVAAPERGLAAPLMIESATTCPSGPAVAEALASLCPPADWPSGVVLIRPELDGLVVELVADESTRRELRVAADCGLRAATVALVIAAWTGSLKSDAAGAPVLRPSAPAEPAPSPAAGATPEVPPARARTTRELGAGLVLSASGSLAAGLRLSWVETRAPRGLGWQLDLVVPAPREQSAGGVTARWSRVGLSLAVNGRTTVGRFALSLDAGLTGAYTVSSGHGYSVDQGAQAITGGVVAGTRVALPWGRLHVFTDVRGHQWLFPQTVAVDTATGARVAELPLPSRDLQWTLGLAYPFR